MLYDSAMKYTVTNKSNTPHDLMTMKGRVVVLANDSVDVELDEGTACVYGEVAFFDVRHWPKVGDVTKHGTVAHVGPPLTEIPTGSRVVANSAPSAEDNKPKKRGRPPKDS